MKVMFLKINLPGQEMEDFGNVVKVLMKQMNLLMPNLMNMDSISKPKRNSLEQADLNLSQLLGGTIMIY